MSAQSRWLRIRTSVLGLKGLGRSALCGDAQYVEQYVELAQLFDNRSPFQLQGGDVQGNLAEILCRPSTLAEILILQYP